MEDRKIKLVDVSDFGFVVEPRYWFYGWSKSPRIFVRESAVSALLKAKNFLPKGYNFKIWDGSRDLKVQLLMLESIRKRISLIYRGLSKTELEKVVLKFGGAVKKSERRLDTHQRGGSFDLTIIDGRGEELYMGTDHDDLTERAATNYFEKNKNLTALEREACKNRRLIKKVLTKAEFKNYAPEWWHWSYNK